MSAADRRRQAHAGVEDRVAPDRRHHAKRTAHDAGRHETERVERAVEEHRQGPDRRCPAGQQQDRAEHHAGDRQADTLAMAVDVGGPAGDEGDDAAAQGADGGQDAERGVPEIMYLGEIRLHERLRQVHHEKAAEEEDEVAPEDPVG